MQNEVTMCPVCCVRVEVVRHIHCMIACIAQCEWSQQTKHQTNVFNCTSKCGRQHMCRLPSNPEHTVRFVCAVLQKAEHVWNLENKVETPQNNRIVCVPRTAVCTSSTRGCGVNAAFRILVPRSEWRFGRCHGKCLPHEGAHAAGGGLQVAVPRCCRRCCWFVCG